MFELQSFEKAIFVKQIYILVVRWIVKDYPVARVINGARKVRWIGCSDKNAFVGDEIHEVEGAIGVIDDEEPIWR